MTLQATTLINSSGTKVTVLNYGAIVQSFVLDNTNIVLGFAEAQDYVKANPAYLGASIGPLANRVAKAQFNLEQHSYALHANENQLHSLHSGNAGLNHVFWQLNEVTNNSVTLMLHRQHLEDGFPGERHFKIRYHLSDANELSIEYWVTTDRASPVDLTNHTYWNLNGNGDILHHEIKFYSSHYLDSKDMIPTGKKINLHDTPLDFTDFKTIGKDLELLSSTAGYDHYFIASDETSDLKCVASVKAKNIQLNVYTTEPGFQFYSGNFLETPYTGFCIEAQNFPNAINIAEFPSPIITTEKPYYQRTVYQLVHT